MNAQDRSMYMQVFATGITFRWYLPLADVQRQLGIQPKDLPSHANIDRSFDATFGVRSTLLGWLSAALRK